MNSPRKEPERCRPFVVWWPTMEEEAPTAVVELRGLLSGSFNPLHAGHLQLQAAASRLLGGPVAFELSIVNADKPPLDPQEIQHRCGQFAGHQLVLTRAPTFVEKCRLFPAVTFVVGADTAQRIVDPRFYQNDAARMQQALETIAGQRCRFLVAARLRHNRLLRLDDLPIPHPHRALFHAIPAADFRLDLSSTELRQQS